MKLVDLNTAKALQEFGCDEEYIYYYRPNGERGNLIADLVLNRPLSEEHIPALRLDDAAYWIRDEYDIAIWIPPSPCGETPHGYNYAVAEWEDGGWNTTWYSEELPYEDALEAAVNKAIEIIKNKKAMNDIYKESFDIATNILSDNTDGYATVAFRGEDGMVCVSLEGDDELLAHAIASAMKRNQELRNILLDAAVLFAKEQGNVIEFKTPKDPSLK